MRAVDGQDLAPGSPVRHHEKVGFYAQCDGKALENFKKRSTMLQFTHQSAHSYTLPTLEAGGKLGGYVSDTGGCRIGRWTGVEKCRGLAARSETGM